MFIIGPQIITIQLLHFLSAIQVTIQLKDHSTIHQPIQLTDHSTIAHIFTIWILGVLTEYS